MSKKCCCGRGCEWCNRDDPRQINYKEVTGTLTTEVPSVGHPLENEAFDNIVYYDTAENKSLLRGVVPSVFGRYRTIWATSTVYGDIQPCWFNGINMKNTTDENPYFKFKYILKVRKRITPNNNPDPSIDIPINSPDYTDVVSLEWEGYGKNIRPHPDACGSFNVTSATFLDAENGCGVFGQPDENGNSPCVLDFAKMPRGPWPYRLKRNLQSDNDGNIIEQACNSNNNPPYSDYYSCCSDPYCSGKEFCNALDDEGTPYGWEDCPLLCPLFSLYNKTDDLANNRRFFCWWNPHNRYTTPEWDVVDFNTQNTRKLSIHVVVPTQKTSVDFCTLENPDNGFGEWSFGMDLEAPEEIAALESSGFNFSNGREDKGVWINKTPTNALRVLFTLTHADLRPGKVWRVFNDWDIKTDANKSVQWDKNQTGEFIVYVEQVLTELAFSSLGCDCPSGGLTQGPQACEYPTDQYLYENCFGVPKISFPERGPLAIRFYADTDDTGAAPTCDNPSPSPLDPNANKVGSRTCSGHGTIMIADAGGLPNAQKISSYPNYGTQFYGIPFLGKEADIPASKGTFHGVDANRYRSLYTPVHFVQKPNYNELGGNLNLYGSYSCEDKDANCTTYNFTTAYEYGPVVLTQRPDIAIIEPCSIYTHVCNVDYCQDDERQPKEQICTPNLVEDKDLPSSFGLYQNCTFTVCRAQSAIQQMCPNVIDWYGIDSDNIYFSANASEESVGYLGDKDCWATCYNLCSQYNSNCWKTDPHGWNCCNFYIAGGNAIGAGFPDTMVKWRKYYCQKYDNSFQDGGQAETANIPIDMMGKLYMECDATKTCSANEFCGCDSFYYTQCISNGQDAFKPIKDLGFGQYKVYTEKYEDLLTDSYFGYYDTNYAPNESLDKEYRRIGNTLLMTPTHKIT